MTKWIRQRASGNYYGSYLNDEEREEVIKADRDFYASRGWSYPVNGIGSDTE